MIRNAKDLSPDQKRAIGSLLGRRVPEDEAISVRAIEPPILSDQRRQELAAERLSTSSSACGGSAIFESVMAVFSRTMPE
jgi:hypothetical protein